MESGTEREIIIARNGKPAARLVPIEPAKKGQRTGVAKGEFVIPEDFDRDDALIARMFGVGEPDPE